MGYWCKEEAKENRRASQKGKADRHGNPQNTNKKIKTQIMNNAETNQNNQDELG